ncbi:hypothetical protein [Occallatibacter savannae]|uniref:hypothetical protein n=1 Tax=Occallatibacter savannae TaxID=1002691 RepID=UPI0013A54DF5|nr:hypothetical protein [Occallatibacter savannae]
MAKIDQATDANAKKELRDRIIFDTERDIIASHGSYVANASRHRAYFQVGADVIVLALTATTSVAGDAAIKAALGAAATGVTGVKTTFMNDFDGGLTRANLLKGMMDNNQANQDMLESKTTLTYEEYGLPKACKDLETFYLGGTEENAFAKVKPEEKAPATPPPATTTPATTAPATPPPATTAAP